MHKVCFNAKVALKRGSWTTPRRSAYPYPTSELFAGQSPDLLRSCGGDGALAQRAPECRGGWRGNSPPWNFDKVCIG